MADWRQVIEQIANDADAYFDAAKVRMVRLLRIGEPICIAAYHGYGAAEKLYIHGRVLEEPHLSLSTDNDTLWNNLVNMYRRFESDEIRGARVKARLGSVEQEAVTDAEGYFEMWLTPPGLPESGNPIWREASLELVAPQRKDRAPVRETCQILVPPPTARFGIISDIDDTVLRTGATSLLQMARTTFLGNARTRLPFEGVAALYRALHQGAASEIVNPIFYVSSSPWNLYDMLAEFFEIQRIPPGPLFLRDWGVSRAQAGRGRHHHHKLAVIRQLLDFYPDLPFILIGDSGQADPEIYHEVVRAYPHRILAVYIRNVSRDPTRIEAIRALAGEVVQAGSSLLLADDTLAMANHALAQGWIAPESLIEIRGEKAADQAPPSLVERLIGEDEPTAPPAIVVEADTATETQAALATGAIEAALQSDSQGQAAPTVIVEGPKEDEG
jgi:phosphatidate phosphatase APP1